MSRSPAQVKEWYAQTHGLNSEQTNAALAYRSAFQQAFNDKVGSSQFNETLEVQASSGAKTVGFLTQIASNITSFFGGGLIGAAGSAVVELDKKRKSETLENISELKPAIESCGNRLQEFTEKMAEDLTILSLQKLEDLSPKEAAKMAREDSENLLSQISKGKFDQQINDSQVMGLTDNAKEEKQALDSLRKSMVDSVAFGKKLNFSQEENLMKAKVAAKTSDGKGKNYGHRDLGSFTHGVIEKETKEKEVHAPAVKVH